MYKVVLLTLDSFGTTGGIQKMTRTLMLALFQLCKEDKFDYNVLSLYDTAQNLDTRYVPQSHFKGFNKRKARFLYHTLRTIKAQDTVVLTHINLASLALLIKLLKPNCQLLLIAHGIEVWRKLPLHKRLLLKFATKIVCVSRYTRQQMIDLHAVPSEKCVVLNNSIDPFIALPDEIKRPTDLLTRYGVTNQTPLLYTLTRLATTEQYKGYDKVIAVVGRIKQHYPGIKYIIAGPYDPTEGERVRQLIYAADASDQVILTGMLDENELPDHFQLADVFVLPSKKEGFGIVFIEAMACGLPVICGNADGSVDAVLDGQLGKAINPDDTAELEHAIKEMLSEPMSAAGRKQLQQKCLEHFNEKKYIQNLRQLLRAS